MLLVDLDGTLLLGNSFRWLVTSLATRDLRTRSASALARVLVLAGATVLRRVRILRRDTYKRFVGSRLRSVLRAPDGHHFLEGFTDLLSRRAAPEVVSCVVLAQNRGMTTVLTTAALADYAKPLAAQYGFAIVVASTTGEPENWRDEKRVQTLAALERSGLEGHPRVLVTDHEDDEFLARVCDVTVWVSRRDTPGEVRARVVSALDELFPASSTLERSSE